MTRGRKPTAAGAELASAVLSDLATGMSHAAIAELHGVSRQRVGAIAKAAGVTTRASRGGTAAHRGAALLARLRELAASSESPSDWLEDTATLASIAGDVVRLLRHTQESRALTGVESTILRMVIDRPDPRINVERYQLGAQARLRKMAQDVARADKIRAVLAAQVRGVVDAAGGER